jgi:hypothetical protein
MTWERRFILWTTARHRWVWLLRLDRRPNGNWLVMGEISRESP